MACPEETPCPENQDISQYDATQIFYHKGCDAGATNLANLNLPNGVDLETFMEAVDTALGNSEGFNFANFDMDCLKSRYVVNTMSQFVQAMNDESCRLDTAYQGLADLGVNLAATNAVIAGILNPQFTNSCGIGFTPSTQLVPAVQAFINHYCNFVGNLTIPQSPAIVGVNNSTIQWNNYGTLNHNLTASVKVSADADNVIEIRSDGLYATIPGVAPVWQTLAWNAGTNELSISNGNTVTIAFPGAQSLSLAGSILTLSGGGGNVDLSAIINPPFSETVLAVTSVNAALSFTQSGTSQHTLALKIEKDVTTGAGNNILQITASGLYVPPPVPSNGLTLTSGTAFKLGGTLTEDTEIDLSTKKLYFKAGATSASFRMSDADGLEIFQHGSPLTKTSIKIESDIFVFKAENGASDYDYLKVDSWTGSAYKVPRVFLGVDNTAADAGNGSRVNVESSLGVRYHEDDTATYSLTENHMLYVYIGQAVPSNQTLTLPDPATSVGIGGANTAWVFWIKNMATDPADTITTTYPIYTDNSTSSTNIAPGVAMQIAAVNGKWIKIN